MTNKDQIDPVESAHLSRYSPDGIVLKIGNSDPITGETLQEVEVTGFAERLTDEMLSGTFTMTHSPVYEKYNQEFMEAFRKIIKEKSRPMTAQEAAAKAIGDWTARNKPTTPPAKKK